VIKRRCRVAASIIAYIRNESARALESLDGGDAVQRVGSLTDLAQAIVENPSPCVILEVPPEGGPELVFAASLAKAFPVLDGALLTDATHPELEEHPLRRFAPREIGSESFQSCMRAHSRDRLRQFQRFEWPLQASLVYGGSTTEYAVRSISAGGAYLESRAAGPPANVEAEITVRFGNFALTSTCTVLGKRMASSKLPSGFPVRFDSLSERARDTIDAIVKDALLDALLNPEEEPEVPSIQEEDSFEDPSLSLLSM
jgi:hypothetical protein